MLPMIMMLCTRILVNGINVTAVEDIIVGVGLLI